MTDFQPTGSVSRRRHGVDGDRKTEGMLADRAQEYDRALRQSRLLARRRGQASILGTSVLAQAPSASSIFVGGGMSAAQTVVLGDSQGSVLPSANKQKPNVSQVIPEEDLAADGGLVSGLGESYVDGGKRSRPSDAEEEEADGLEDGGVLGLLAQIYGNKEVGLRG